MYTRLRLRLQTIPSARLGRAMNAVNRQTGYLVPTGPSTPVSPMGTILLSCLKGKVESPSLPRSVHSFLVASTEGFDMVEVNNSVAIPCALDTV